MDVHNSSKEPGGYLKRVKRIIGSRLSGACNLRVPGII